LSLFLGSEKRRKRGKGGGKKRSVHLGPFLYVVRLAQGKGGGRKERRRGEKRKRKPSWGKGVLLPQWRTPWGGKGKKRRVGPCLKRKGEKKKKKEEALEEKEF